MIVDKLKRLEEDGERTMFSATVANELIDIVNALRALHVTNGKVTWSDARVVIDFSGSVGSGTTSTSGSNLTFVSSSVYCLARWT